MQKNQQPHLKLPGVAALTWVIVAQYVSFLLSPTLPLPQNASSPPHPKLPLTSPLPGALSNLQAAEHQCFTGILAFAQWQLALSYCSSGTGSVLRALKIYFTGQL